MERSLTSPIAPILVPSTLELRSGSLGRLQSGNPPHYHHLAYHLRCLPFIPLPSFIFLFHLSLLKREKGKPHTCPQLPLCHLSVNDAIGVDCQAILCCSHARDCLDSLLNSQVISPYFPKGLCVCNVTWPRHALAESLLSPCASFKQQPREPAVISPSLPTMSFS